MWALAHISSNTSSLTFPQFCIASHFISYYYSILTSPSPSISLTFFMSTADPPISAAGVGLGYGIAIAVSILVLISTIMLVSYACIRVKGGGSHRRSNSDDGGSNAYRLSHSFATEDSIGPVMVVGLDELVIKSYPKVVLGESRRLPKPNNGPCSICLCDYKAKDTIRCIPDCRHCFHAGCVDEWLKMSATCPLCRNSPAPSAGSTPIATPLSELMPLSFHSR